MKKILLLAIALPFANTLFAQEYLPLQISSGYNADVIANGIGPSVLSTNSSMDNANFAFISADFQAFAGDGLPDYALPVSGIVNNTSMPGLTYQMAPYSGNNSIRLPQQLDAQTVTFSNAAPVTTLYLLASTGSGNATLGGTITFSDNSTQEITQGVIPDWFYSNALPVVLSGFGRIGIDSDIIENPIGNPRLYQYQIGILAANQTKTISSIQFSKQSFEEGVINIFAISAKLLGTCPSPSLLFIENVTNNSASVDWSNPPILPANGYQYYLSTTNTAPTPSTVPTGTAPTSALMLTQLTIGTTYCIWIRSVCSATEFGSWIPANCFTTGQIEVTNPNDIPTLYADFVDVSSTTSCPGTLTVNVPLGYQIASVSTAYNMQTASNGWISEQNSILVCNTTGMMESNITTGLGNTTGTYGYSRDGLAIANGATGAVEFELRAWRTYGGADCNIDFNRVVGGTWTVSVTLSELLATKAFAKNDFAIYPNPTTDLLKISGNEIISEVALYNLLGQQVLLYDGLNAKEAQLTTFGLPSGKYLLKITSESGVQSKSILKN